MRVWARVTWALIAFLLVVGVATEVETSNRGKIEENRRKRLELQGSYPSCRYGSHPGKWVKTELDIRKASTSVEACGSRKKPSAPERRKFWNPLRTGEMTLEEVKKTMEADCLQKQPNLGPWSERMPNRVYAWSVDFHPAPGVCNFPVYNDIGVTLHLECDTEPQCRRGGVCRNRLKAFELGFAGKGYALDPEPNKTISEFYQAIKDDEEMNRVDVFVCSHPAANCELFEPLIEASDTKSMIMYPTTRLEFGRNDPMVHWREVEIKKMGTWFELSNRWKRLMDFMHKYSSSVNGKKKRLWLVANNMYDLAYTEYFTGIRPVYIPSWCGDLDNSFGHSTDWTGCSLLAYNTSKLYHPEHDLSLFVTHTNKHMAGNDPKHVLVQELNKARKNFTKTYGTKAPQIAHSADVIDNHRPEAYKQYKAVIWLPYQTSQMSFFEFYRQNIPIFAPSVHCLKHWHWSVDMLAPRIYGAPKREIEKIRAYVEANGGVLPDEGGVDDIPSPNWQHHWKNMDYWFGYSDQYIFDHVILFDNFDHLLYLLNTVNLSDIARRMSEFNVRQRESIMVSWHDIFRQAAPHRDRSLFLDDYGIDVAEVRKWTKIQDKKIEARVMQHQGLVNPCIRDQSCTGSIGTVHYSNITDYGD